MAKARSLNSNSPNRIPTPRTWIVACVLAISLGAVYGRFLNVPFVYDDLVTIVENPSITSFWPLIGRAGQPGPLNPAQDQPTSGRPLVNLSLAINYHFGKLNPTGYHAVSLAIHFLSSLLLFAIIRRTLLLPYFDRRFEASAGWFAFAASILWALHPLQTEAVIYATQRTELMMAFFYLATLYCSLRYLVPLPPRERQGKGSLNAKSLSQPRTVWLTLAIFASLAGMASKEVMVSAPLMVLLFDRAFISGSIISALRRSWPLYLGLAATWILLLFLTINTPRGNTAGFGLRISGPVWWLIQSKVFLMYLKLVVWPWPLLIYYELPEMHSFSESWMYLLPVIVLGITTLVLLWRNHPVGYLLTWVFAILAPTSVVPIVTEMAAERRMYLPLAALAVLAIVALWRLAGFMRKGVLFPVISTTTLLAILFYCVDVHRLNSYRDEKTLWREVIDDQPNNIVAHNNLATLLVKANRWPEVIKVTRALLALKPDHPVALNSIGVALIHTERSAEAIDKLREAVRLSPGYAYAHNSLGLALTNTGQHDEALQEFKTVLSLHPNDIDALFNMGLTYSNLGRYQEAIDYYEQVLKLKPGFTDAHLNMGFVFHTLGKDSRALEQFQLVLKQDPNDANAHNNLGLLVSSAGQTNEAIEHFEQALRSAPDRSDIHHNLAEEYLRVGRPNDALHHFQIAFQLNPGDMQSAVDLIEGLTQAGRPQEAIAAAKKAIEIARATNQPAAAERIDSWLRKHQDESGATAPQSPAPPKK